jgi:hypothetical protein
MRMQSTFCAQTAEGTLRERRRWIMALAILGLATVLEIIGNSRYELAIILTSGRKEMITAF